MLQARDLLSENLQTWCCSCVGWQVMQLAIVRGKKLYWMNCLVIREVEKLQNACVERVSPGV